MNRRELLELKQHEIEPGDEQVRAGSGLIQALIKASIEDQVLMISMFDIEKCYKAETTDPEVVVYLTKEDFIKRKNGKWRTGRLQTDFYEIGRYVHWSKDAEFHMPEDRQAVEDFMKGIDFMEDRKYWGVDPETTMGKLSILMDWMAEKRLERKHQKIIEKIDKKMEQIKPLPKDWNEWLDRRFPAYIIYKRKGKRVEGYCTYCKRDVEVKTAMHNDEGRCPKCKQKVIFKAKGRVKKLADSIEVAYIQKTSEGFVVRYVSAAKEYQRRNGMINETEPHRDPKINQTEYLREFYKGESTEAYWFGRFRNTNKIRWDNHQNDDNIIRAATTYTKNLKQALKNTQFKYCAIEKMARKKEVDIKGYLETYERHRVIEYLVKLGFYNLVDESTKYYPWITESNLNLGGKTIEEVLMVDKMQVKRLREMDPTNRELNLFRQIYDRATNEEIRKLTHVRWLDFLLEHASPRKIVNYIESQTEDIETGSIDWRDYIQDCKKLKYDLNDPYILFPKDLQGRHVQITRLIQNIENKEVNKKLEKVHRKAQALDFKYKNMTAKAARTAQEMIEEGKALRHCVSSYAEKMAREDTFIFFIRKIKEPNKPFFTAEVDPETYEILQCRGKSNCQPNDEVKRFMKRWKKELEELKNEDRQKIAI